MIKDNVETTAAGEPLRKLLKTWTGLVRRTFETTRETHAPYSYKELTNVGVLAAASFSIGWVALEECAVERSVDSKIIPGRLDLSIWNSERQRFLIEAKLTVRSVDTLKKRLDVVVKTAKKDVDKLCRNPMDKSYAMVFVIPRFDEDADNNYIEKGISKALALCREQEPDFLAYTFPGKVERRASDRMDHGQYAYGIIVLGFARDRNSCNNA